jgi:hypothetical protein
MLAALIGIGSGLIIILRFTLSKQIDKTVIYGLILCAIGFLYVGYVWADLRAIVINAIQAVVFLFIAYYGIKKNNTTLLGIGYFLHGTWDIVYHLFQDPGLIPPHYDIFCLSIDFTIGAYLLLLSSKYKKLKVFQSR